jgi:hypothetical protein
MVILQEPGRTDAPRTGCENREGWASVDGDCDDDDPYVFPGAPETCNALDDDCDGEVDEACPE